MDELDQGHVLPNMGVPQYRGVWYPLGFALPGTPRWRDDLHVRDRVRGWTLPDGPEEMLVR